MQKIVSYGKGGTTRGGSSRNPRGTGGSGGGASVNVVGNEWRYLNTDYKLKASDLNLSRSVYTDEDSRPTDAQTYKWQTPYQIAYTPTQRERIGFNTEHDGK